MHGAALGTLVLWAAALVAMRARRRALRMGVRSRALRAAAAGAATSAASGPLTVFSRQVGGGSRHKAMLAKPGVVLKELQPEARGARELAFYRHVHLGESLDGVPGIGALVASLRRLIPAYVGVADHSGDMLGPDACWAGASVRYLVLRDLTSRFRRPCVADLKMGSRTFPPCAPPEKQARELAKYAWQQELGFRFVDFRVSQLRVRRRGVARLWAAGGCAGARVESPSINPHNHHPAAPQVCLDPAGDDEGSCDGVAPVAGVCAGAVDVAGASYCRALTPESIGAGFERFFAAASERTVARVAARVDALTAWFEAQSGAYRFFSASLLIVYDGVGAGWGAHAVAGAHTGVPAPCEKKRKRAPAGAGCVTKDAEVVSGGSGELDSVGGRMADAADTAVAEACSGPGGEGGGEEGDVEVRMIDFAHAHAHAFARTEAGAAHRGAPHQESDGACWLRGLRRIRRELAAILDGRRAHALRLSANC